MTTVTLPVHLFKDSYDPFVTLLCEVGITFEARMPPVGVPQNAGHVIDVLVQSKEFWVTLATVICAFLKNRRSRKVIITTRGNTVVHAEGLGQTELMRVLQQAQSIAAIVTKPNQ